MPGWYPDPTGTARRAYWNGREWEAPQPRPPFKKRVLIVVGSIVGGLVLLGLLGNIGSNGDDAKPVASTLTKTVTVDGPATDGDGDVPRPSRWRLPRAPSSHHQLPSQNRP